MDQVISAIPAVHRIFAMVTRLDLLPGFRFSAWPLLASKLRLQEGIVALIFNQIRFKYHFIAFCSISLISGAFPVI